MIIKFPKKKITEEVWNYLDSRFSKNLINYIIDSKYRRSVSLSSWLKPQVLEQIEIDEELKGATHDETMHNILNWIRRNIKYTSDNKSWNMNEYWQTGKETFDSKKGDCEDGAILMYIIARQNDVPANRLLLMAGDVLDPNDKKKIKMVGHCWLAYKPDSYPINFTFLDWCYYYNANSIENRPKYYIDAKSISDIKYKSLWFAFSENKSHSELRYTAGEFQN